MLRYFFILLYFFSSCLVVAQDFEIRQYSIPEGLPQSQIFAIEEDNYGYLWVGTASGGLSKFDGTKFSNYTTRDGLLSNSINDFEIDSQNNIWVAHPNGISKFNGDNFKTYPIPDTLTFLRRILSLHLEADTLHISSLPSMYGRIVNDSLQYWDGSLFPGKGVSAIVRGPEHALYFFLSSYEVFIRKGMVAKMLPLPTSAWLPRSIYRTPDGLIFQSAEQAAAISFKEGTSVLLPNKDLRRRNLLYDSVRNEFWRPAGDSIVIERPGKHSSIYVGSFVNRMLMDRAGSVWIATDDRGLLKVNRKSMRRVESTAGLRVSNMLLVNGDLWFGTYGQGLYKYRDGALTRFFFDTAVSERNSINGLEYSPSGEIWVSTQRGIGIFDTTGKPLRWITKITEQLPMLESTTIAFDANGIPWSGTMNMGAIMLGADTTYLFNRSNSEFPNSAVSSLDLPFYKKLAIGHQSGYSLADSASVQTFNISPVKNSMVLAMSSYQDSLVVLATSGAGIVIHSPKSGRWINFHSKNELKSDLVFLVGVDADQNIWAGTERGISRLRLNADWELIEHRFYATPETNQEAFSLEGKKFFGTTEGLYEYDAANDEVVENISPLHFTGIAHDNIDHVDYDSGFFHLPVNLRLPYDKNWIEFSFKKILKSELSPASYRYRLENFDREWSAPSSVDNVRYSNLPPGAYTFRVRADNGVDGLHDQELSYEFVVVPPFYVTTIFRLMLMVAAVLFVAGIMYWRIRARVNRVLARERMRNEEQAKLRKEMAQDFHDEMGNQLARIINYTGQLQLRVKPQDEKSQLYQKIEQTAKTLFFGTRDFIWSMNPDNENTSDVFGHIKYFGENMFNDSNIAFSGDSKLFYSLPLPFGFSREITLIFKEAFTNIYKYSQSKEVNFLLHEDQGVIEFVVIDDGLGFPAGERAAGHGLSNMHNRAAKINSDLSIYSEAGCGTKISLRLSNLKPPPYVNNRLQKADSHY